MPEPLERKLIINVYVDANHYGNLFNRRLYIFTIIYVNNKPNIWYSKIQNTVDSSFFGSNSVALNIAVDIIENIRYNLCCFIVDIDVTAEVFCDNNYVVKDSNVLDIV